MKNKIQEIFFYIITFSYATFYIALSLIPKLHNLHNEILILGIILFIGTLLNNSAVMTKSRRLKVLMGILILFLAYIMTMSILDLKLFDGHNVFLHLFQHAFFSVVYLYTLLKIHFRAKTLHKDNLVNEKIFNLGDLVVLEYYFDSKKLFVKLSEKAQAKYNIDANYEFTLDMLKSYSPSFYNIILQCPNNKNIEDYIGKITKDSRDMSYIINGVEFYRDYAVFLISDYTAIAELEKEIDETHYIHSKLLKNLPLIVMEIKLLFNENNKIVDYEYVYLNEAFSKSSKIPVEELIGAKGSDINPKQYTELLREYAKAYRTNKRIEFTRPVFSEDKLHYFIVYNSTEDNVIVIIQPIHEIIEANRKLEYLLTHNFYNDLLNYDGLMREINSLETSDRVDAYHIMVRNYNDIKIYYGQEYARDIVKEIALMINENITVNKLLANYESDKCILIVRDVSDEEIKEVNEFLSEKIYQKHTIQNMKINTKLDIGHASMTNNVESSHIVELISHATIASLEARKEIKNYIVNYDKHLSDELDRRISIAGNILDAIENEVIEIYFQKIINAKDKKVISFEALARWHDKELGYINPEEMLSIARESSLSEYLNYYLIDQSLLEYKILIKDKYQDAKLNINLDPYFFDYEDSFDYIIERVDYYGIPKTNICLEVSENTFVKNIGNITEQIKYLRSLGFLVAIDDFGSKFSSLGVLELIQFDILKLDGIFVKHKESDIYRAILSNFIKTIKGKEKIVVIEKIETEEESQVFIDYDCFIQQGYYFHKPSRNTEII